MRAMILCMIGMVVMCVLSIVGGVLTAQANVVVIDANQKILGQALNVNGGGASATLAFSVTIPFALTAGEPAFVSFPFLVVLTATKTRLLAPTLDPLWESSDCTGPPLLNMNQAGGIEDLLSNPVMVVSQLNPGQDVLGKVYLGFPIDTPQSVTIHSKIDAHNPRGCLDLGTNSFQAMVSGTTEIMDLDAQFTPPFHLEVQPATGQAHPYDLNGDGRADLLWRHKGSGEIASWLMNGSSIFSSAILGGVPSEWKIEQVADVNGDGKADVVWQNINGTVAIWLMNGTVIESVGFPGGVSNEWELQP